MTNKEFKALSREYKEFEVSIKTKIPIIADNGEGGYKITGWKDSVGSAGITECVSASRKIYQELKKFEKNPNYNSKLRPLPSDRDLEALQQQILAETAAEKETNDGKHDTDTREESIPSPSESGLQS